MSKEMFISSSPHETKVAVLEDDQLVEVYYERETDVGLVGGIYKGRVSRVLPGMQSAFVDIGLERDAFLYVSDFFFEDQEEFDKVFDEAEARVTRFVAEQATQPAVPLSKEKVPEAATAVPASGPGAAEPATVQAAPEVRPSEPHPSEGTVTAPLPVGTTAAPTETTGEAREHRRYDPRGRQRRRRGRGFGDRRFREHKFAPRSESAEHPSFEILPGESLAKYSHVTPEAASPETPVIAPSEPGGMDTQGLMPSEALVTPEVTSSEPPSVEVAPADVPPPEVEATASVVEPERVAETKHPAPWGESSPLLGEVPPIEQGLPEIPPLPPSVPEPQAITKPSEPPVSASAREAAEYVAPTASAMTEPRSDAAVVPAEPLPEPLVGESPVLSTEMATPLAEEIEQEAAPAPTPESLPEPSATAPGEPVLTTEPTSSASPPSPATAGEATPPESSSVPAGPPETSAEPGERTYTLREPHQRPRFAPRRGQRGQKGLGRRPARQEGWRESSRPGNNQPVQIAELLKEGQEILVQIAKEPLGTKGARITSHIALPGRYLVYMPTINHIGVSRKIVSEEERLRLRNNILENRGSLTGGFIVRTAGEGRSAEEFRADLRFLSTLWGEIRAKSERVKAPALLHRDLDLVQRLLRDTLTPEFKCIRVDSELDYERVLDFVNRSQPSLVGKVKLYTRHTPLFEESGVQAEIEKALRPKVWLKSGGYIVINQTEALVAIDVNTGKYVGKTNRLEDTILKTNIDAVNEIVRQIRLRDLGGIIVIDFIDMDERKNRSKVIQALEEALRRDRAPTKVISFYDFGLVAITRKRVKQSLERTLCEPCTACAGSGWVKSVATVCYEILAEAQKMARQIEGDALTLRVNPEVAKALKSREGGLISELESLTKKDVIIRSDPSVHQERFEIF